MKKRTIVVSISMFILIILLFIFKFVIQPYIIKTKFENNIVSFLNEDGKSSITEYSNWLKYAKSEMLEEYDISGLVKDYINAIDLAIQKRLNQNKKIRYNQYYKSGGLDVVAEHGIQDSWIEYIANNITEEDILAYTENRFFEKLIVEIEKVFIHKSNQRDRDWYIKNDVDKTIELPYNVYYTFICDHKKLKNEVKEIISINAKEINEHFTNCDVKYKNYNNIICKKNIELFNNLNRYTKEKTYFYSDFKDLYYTDSNMPTLTAGQHDYDEAEEKKSEELDALIVENAKLGLEQTPMFNWDDYDEDGNYIREESTAGKEIYDWAVADLQKKALEYKNKGVRASESAIDIKIFESEESQQYDLDKYSSDDYLTDEDKEAIDSNLRIQREMVEKLWNKAKESLNDGK